MRFLISELFEVDKHTICKLTVDSEDVILISALKCPSKKKKKKKKLCWSILYYINICCSPTYIIEIQLAKLAADIKENWNTYSMGHENNVWKVKSLSNRYMGPCLFIDNDRLIISRFG